jgi:hypothetical protein
MSGKEEEPDRDIPICDRCKTRPEFWIFESSLKPYNKHGWFWFHSNKVMEIENCSRLVYVPSTGGCDFTLDEVVRIRCRPEIMVRNNNAEIHIFTVGDPMFDKVLKQARRCKVEWEG